MSRAGLKLFAGAADGGGFVLRLVETKHFPKGVIGVFAVDGMDELQERLAGFGGQQYAPVPGLWASLVPMAKGNDGGSELRLLVGVSRSHGLARSEASKAFGDASGDLVTATEIGALFTGYLSMVGV